MPTRRPGPAASRVARLSEAPSRTTATSRTVLARRRCRGRSARPGSTRCAGPCRVRWRAPKPRARRGRTGAPRPIRARGRRGHREAQEEAGQDAAQGGEGGCDEGRGSHDGLAGSLWICPPPCRSTSIRSNRTLRWFCSLLPIIGRCRRRCRSSGGQVRLLLKLRAHDQLPGERSRPADGHDYATGAGASQPHDPDRPIVRLLAAVILVILASFVPPAVQAHEGHAHHAGYGSATHMRTASVAAVPAANPAGHVARAEPLAYVETALRITAVAPIRDAGCCPGPCRVRCCGTMACCAAGILPARPPWRRSRSGRQAGPARRPRSHRRRTRSPAEASPNLA